MKRHALLGRLEKGSTEPPDDQEFPKLVLDVMLELDLTVSDVAKMFVMSRPAVRRWIAGTSAPHPEIRKTVCFRLGEIVARGGRR